MLKWHRTALACLLLGGLAADSGAEPMRFSGAKPVTVRAAPLQSFEIGNSDRTVFGDLEWLGGLELTGSSRHFGALSGLTVSDDGRDFVAVTDNGFWVSGRIESNGQGAPTALSDVTMAPLRDRSGAVLNLKSSADAEAVARATINGRPVFLVAFERNHRIEAYPRAIPGQRVAEDARPIRYNAPAGIRRLGANKGIEAIAVGPPDTPAAGLTVMFAERGRPAGSDIPAWLVRPDGTARAFAVRQRDRFDITDAVFLANGDVVILERRFDYSTGIFMRLRRLPFTALGAGRVVDGPVMMTADFTDQIDNMEALATHREADGSTVFTILSDDNRSFLQRTLLLRFRLREPEAGITPRSRPQASAE